MRLDGDWVDYAVGVQRIIERYKPSSMIELGCGFFVALEAISERYLLQSYVGVDVRPNARNWTRVRKDYNLPHFMIARCDVHALEIEWAKADFVLLDAHDGSAEQYGLDTRRQLELTDRIEAPVVAVDDCRIDTVAKETNFFWGSPTWKANEITGLWVWER